MAVLRTVADPDVTDTEIRRRAEALLDAFAPTDRNGGAWLGAAYDAGLAWVSFPVGMGGLGAHHSLQAIVEATLATEGASLREATENVVGYGMAAPLLVDFAEPSLARRWLPPLFRLDEWWCQLFSEPGAGSDLGSLATRAVPDGGGWRVTGQKVWTTLGHKARWAILVARTDPSVPKHKGLTFFVLDMNQAGIDVRPLRQLTGDAEFNEVFLDGAWVPDAHRLGAVGDGWRVAMATLSNERHTVAEVGSTPKGAIDRVIALYRSNEGDRTSVERDRLVRLWIEDQVLQQTIARAEATRNKGTPPGPEGSIAKLARTTLDQRILDLAIDLLGPAGSLFPEGGFGGGAPGVEADLRWQFLRSRAATIEGGTSEVMRNILGERILGLPREPAVDRDLPWNAVLR
jgi:alkylation response protein AidB-like acyl-CoA dehydrogenase